MKFPVKYAILILERERRGKMKIDLRIMGIILIVVIGMMFANVFSELGNRLNQRNQQMEAIIGYKR